MKKMSNGSGLKDMELLLDSLQAEVQSMRLTLVCNSAVTDDVRSVSRETIGMLTSELRGLSALARQQQYLLTQVANLPLSAQPYDKELIKEIATLRKLLEQKITENYDLSECLTRISKDYAKLKASINRATTEVENLQPVIRVASFSEENTVILNSSHVKDKAASGKGHTLPKDDRKRLTVRNYNIPDL
jgi:hypothetical protein